MSSPAASQTCQRPKCKRTKNLNKFKLCGGHGCPTPNCPNSKSSLAIVCQDHADQSLKPVPKGWAKCTDPAGLILYLNEKLFVAQYNHPGEKAEDAMTRTTKTPIAKPAKGAPIVFMIEPAATDLPAGWEEILAVAKSGINLHGMKLYHNHKDSITQASDPRPPPEEEASLPSGWTQAFDAENDVYFIDHNSGLMTYDDPRVVPNPKPATSIPGQTVAQPRRASGGVIKQRKFTVKNKSKWTINAGNKTLFSALSNNLTKPEEIPEIVRNKVHNRFMDILPNPKTRVELSSNAADPTSSYYNANYVRGPEQQERAYIASMGPRPANLEHFWRMIWENGCKVIVMATGLVETGQSKCERYWPAHSTDPYFEAGTIRVMNAGSKIHQGYVRTELRVERQGEQRKVSHYWYNTWPDHGVPKTADKKIFADDIVGMLKDLRTEVKHDPAPIVVHCSAGIGRTGTIIAIDHAMQLLHANSSADLIAVIKQIREDRCAMIQHAQQYEFFVEACVRHAVLKNHPYQLNFVKEEVDPAADTAKLNQAELEALRKKEKEDAHARATEAAAKGIVISTSQIQGELRLDPGMVSFGGQTYKFIDSNGAGSMSREAAMQQGMTVEVFDSIDADASGDITLEEFIAFQRGLASD